MLKAGKFEHGVVAARPDQIYGWPGMTKVNGEEILAAASERKYHVDPVGREVVIRSQDGGRTWGLPQEVYNSELDDRDANILTMPDGTVILTWFTSVATLGWINPEGPYCLPEPWRSRWEERYKRQGITFETETGGWLLRSADGGHSWDEALPTPAGQHAGPGVTSDGCLIYIGSGGPEGPAPVFESVDKGESWAQISEVPAPTTGDPPRSIIDENHVLEVTPGHLLAMFRSGFDRAEEVVLYQSHSADAGYTWSEVERLPILGHPPHLMRLESGAILCTYGYRENEPCRSIRAVLSYDEGQTWDVDNIIILYEFELPCDMGYPVSVEVKPGQILTIYYTNKKEIPGQPRIIYPYREDAGGLLYTRWALE